MKTCFSTSLLAAMLLVLVARLAHGQGTIIQHTGSNNPTNEGFSLVQDGYVSTGTIVGDLGMNAWQTTIGNNSGIEYTYSLTPQQQAEILGADWTLSLTLRDLQSFGGDFVELMGTENELFSVYPDFLLNGDGAAYHNIQIIYSAASDTASLWIDGTEETSDYLSDLSAAGGIEQITWGETQVPAEANWNLVSFEVTPEVTPEPTSAAVLLLGGGVSLYLRRKYRR